MAVFPLLQNARQWIIARSDWSLLILITYSNITPIAVVSCFSDRNFRRILMPSAFQTRIPTGEYQRPLPLLLFFGQKSIHIHKYPSGISVGRATWFIQYHSFCAISFVEPVQTVNTLEIMLLEFLVDTENY